MIYCNCDQCGLHFRKGHYKKPKCLRCGNPDLWEEDVPADSITLADRIADKILRESIKGG